MNSDHPLEILVEELSAEFALRSILPKIVPGEAFEIRVFRGKPDLLKKLPARLAGYAAWPGAVNAKLAVVVDRDDDDCEQLRQQLDAIATRAGFVPRGPMRGILIGSA